MVDGTGGSICSQIFESVGPFCQYVIPDSTSGTCKLEFSMETCSRCQDLVQLCGPPDDRDSDSICLSDIAPSCANVGNDPLLTDYCSIIQRVCNGFGSGSGINSGSGSGSGGSGSGVTVEPTVAPTTGSPGPTQTTAEPTTSMPITTTGTPATTTVTATMGTTASSGTSMTTTTTNIPTEIFTTMIVGHHT